MAPERTKLDELVRKYFDSSVAEALNNVVVYKEIAIEAERDLVITLDSLAERQLTPEVNQSLPHVDVKAEVVGFGLELKELRLYIQGRGLSILILLLTLASFILGSDKIQFWLRTILSTQQ